MYGFEAERHVFRCLISSIDLNRDLKTINNISGKDFHQIELLKKFVNSSLNKPNFGSMIRFAFENSFNFQQLPLDNRINIISQFSRILKLNRTQKKSMAFLLKNFNKDKINYSKKPIELIHSVYAELGLYF